MDEMNRCLHSRHTPGSGLVSCLIWQEATSPCHKPFSYMDRQLLPTYSLMFHDCPSVCLSQMETVKSEGGIKGGYGATMGRKKERQKKSHSVSQSTNTRRNRQTNNVFYLLLLSSSLLLSLSFSPLHICLVLFVTKPKDKIKLTHVCKSGVCTEFQ